MVGNNTAYSAASCTENAAPDTLSLYCCNAIDISVANCLNVGSFTLPTLLATFSAEPTNNHVSQPKETNLS
jgi:hypothetical protein